MENISIETLITVIINLVLVISFFCKQSNQITQLSEQFIELKLKIKESRQYTNNIFTSFKKAIEEKIIEARSHTDEHIRKLEEKQDKHNNLIERMVIVEQSTKSAHHRIDKLEEKKQ